MEPVLKNVVIYDWIILLYFVLAILLVVARAQSNYKFEQFVRLFFSNTYTKTYRINSLSKPFHLFFVGFTILLFPLQLQVVGSKLGYLSGIFFVDYFRFLVLFLGFYLLKTVLSLIFAKMVRFQKAITAFIFFKQTYFAYLVFLGFFPVLSFVYNGSITVFWIYLFVYVWFALYLLSYLLVIFSLKELLFSRLLYFILYICTFEIPAVVGAIYFLRLQ